MKNVVKSTEVAHLWAHQLQERAQNSGGYFYFEGRTIYSYGSHFPIATFYDLNEKVILFTTRTYSNSTAKHCSHVRYALSNDAKVFYVPYLCKDSDTKNDRKSAHKKNVEYLVGEIEELGAKQLKVRTADYTVSIKRAVDSLKEYIEYFKCKYALKKSKYYLFSDEFMDGLAEQSEVVAEKNKEANKRRIEANKGRIADWYRGIGYATAVRSATGGYAVLRAVSKEEKQLIQTSLGVEVDYWNGKRIFEILLARRSEGVTVSLEGMKVDNWSLQSLSSDGVLTAGCHKIKWSEIIRFAKEQNWQTNEW